MNETILLTALLFTALAWLMPSAGSAGVITAQLEARVGQLQAEEEVDILVYMNEQLDFSQFREMNRTEQLRSIKEYLQEKAEKTQAAVKALLVEKHARNIHSLWIVNGLAATVRAETVSELARQPEVDRISLDGRIRLPRSTVSTSSEDSEDVYPWNIELTGAPELWAQGFDGSGTVVAIMDSGVDPEHQALKSRWRGGNNSWYDPNQEHSTPYDNDGHGTWTTGIILGTTSGETRIGMAPGAQWIGVKIFDDHGEAAYSAIHLGFQWLLDPDNDPLTPDQPHIINNSWGMDALVNQCFTEFQPDIQALLASDIAVNFSAGNTGPAAASSISPANYPESLAVGGVDNDLEIAGFSSRGPSACGEGFYPLMVAPAVDIRTSDLTFGGLYPENSAVVSGTSFAVPHISGAMALIRQVHPWLTVDELQFVLTRSARDLGEDGPDHDSGYGLVDMVAALDLLAQYTCTDESGDSYFSIEGCSNPPEGGEIPKNAKGWLSPVIHLLLDGSGSSGHSDVSHRSPATGQNIFFQSTRTHGGYHENSI